MINSKQKDKTNRQALKERGFTLIEVLISLAMIAILTGATLQVVRFSDTQKSLIIESDKFRSAIREAQSYSLSIPNNDSQHICGFGVFAASDGSSYELFYTYATDESWKVNPGEACSGCLGYNIGSGCEEGTIGASTGLAEGMAFTEDGKGADIFFKAPYGDVYQNGAAVSDNTTFTIEYGGTREQNITINKFGKVE